MTIREYVTSKKEMSINEWLKQIALDGLKKHESVIIRCADEYNLITIDNSTTVLDDLIGSINNNKKIKIMETTKKKKKAIAQLVKDMLNESHEAMLKKIDKALNSGAVDVDEWDEAYNPMILPKCILIAILQDEATQYEGKGTSFEKRVKAEVKNIRYFL